MPPLICRETEGVRQFPYNSALSSQMVTGPSL